MELRKYETVMIRAAAAGTQYEDALAHFYNTTTIPRLHHLVFSPEVQPKKLLDLDKKMPDFLLLGECHFDVQQRNGSHASYYSQHY